MENPAFPETKITLDKERTIKLTLGALADYERLSGRKALKGEYDSRSSLDILNLLWACLHQEDPNLTPEAVGRMITADKIIEASVGLAKAIVVAFPKPKENAEDPLPK